MDAHPDLFDFAPLREFLIGRCSRPGRPSARELLIKARQKFGFRADYDFLRALADCGRHPHLTEADRGYFASMLRDGSADDALRGEQAEGEEVFSAVDALLRESAVYRSSEHFRDLIAFMGRFKQYSPYNNMLVRLQNPQCQFYATARDWDRKHGRKLVRDARPMLILAPMHPVLPVYELAQTEGPPLPRLLDYSVVAGEWKSRWLNNLEENARRHRMVVRMKSLPFTNGGFVHREQGSASWKVRIVLNSEREEPQRFRTLVHEVAHVLLGHLGTDRDGWWPDRRSLSKQVVEVEAEAASHIVASRFGLRTESAAYLAGYVGSGEVPQAISIDTIAKVASKIEEMAKRKLPPPKPKPPAKPKKVRSP